MGFRHYLYIIDKDNFKQINSKYIESLKEDDCVWFPDILDKKGGKEIFELGKYSDEGYDLADKDTEIPQDLQQIYSLLKKFSDDQEYAFNILNVNDLILIINSYQNRCEKYWQELISEEQQEETTREARLIKAVNEKLNWVKFMCNTKLSAKNILTDSWLYEWEVFNLLHILKMYDWNKNLLIIIGY